MVGDADGGCAVTTIRAEGETIVIEKDGNRFVIEELDGVLYAFDRAYSSAVNRQNARLYKERMDAETAAWRAKHPNAIEIAPHVYRDGFDVRDHWTNRAPRAGEVGPPMRVKVRGGRVGHLWAGGDWTLCGKWGDHHSVTPCDLPPCPKCAGKMP